MSADGELEGSVAVVTGAFGKLGPVWVNALAGAGATVVGLDVRDDGAAPLAERAAAAGGSFRLELADVTDRAAVGEVARRVEAVDGVPSVLVNSAGIDQPPSAEGHTARIEDVPTEDFRRTLDVNLTGTFNASQAFGARMVEAGRGSIVNIGSLYASIAPDPSFYDHLEVDPPFLKPAAYGASKAGVLNLTRYFARLWGPRGVRVNALSPGGVRAGQDAEFVRKYCARVPLGRMAEADDLAGPLLFLVSDSSRYLTGHELRVDGGFTA
jgi:NAD(P)-dependent dehydrogenase (short-subunit alcohol dehydrogenase family)